MISIRERLRPFSHQRGAKCLLPGTSVQIQAFPHLLHIGSLEIPLDNDPLNRDSTLQQDLERNCVWVFGKNFRIKLTAKPDGVEMILNKKSIFFPMALEEIIPKEIERLSLGSNKAQDWDLILRRFDLKEILPPLYFLSQKTANILPVHSQNLETFYLSSFSDMMVPKNLNETKPIFGTTFGLIRSLFFQEKENKLILLPNNPFPEGRLLNIQMEMGSLDMEWSKNQLRRVTLFPKKTGEIFLDLPEKITSFRCQKTIKAGKSLFVEAGVRMHLDRFYTAVH